MTWVPRFSSISWMGKFTSQTPWKGLLPPRTKVNSWNRCHLASWANHHGRPWRSYLLGVRVLGNYWSWREDRSSENIRDGWQIIANLCTQFVHMPLYKSVIHNRGRPHFLFWEQRKASVLALGNYTMVKLDAQIHWPNLSTLSSHTINRWCPLDNSHNDDCDHQWRSFVYPSLLSTWQWGNSGAVAWVFHQCLRIKRDHGR